jgi:NADPH-dependent glutamate synthase beta subunit-like oxidoreductase/Pyruvate/2-oxoacid:ferredoxin oxidoreductase delta subunit
VVGGCFSAVQAALDLAESGIPVTIVERSPFLGCCLGADASASGGSRENPTDGTTRLLQVIKHPNIRVITQAAVTAVQGRKGDFHVEIERSPRYVDLLKCTACGDCVVACPVTVPTAELAGAERRTAIFGGGDGAVPNIYAIEKRGVAPCKATCPGGIHVQGYVALIAQGRFREALDLIREAVPLAGVLGRVCYHPCEDGCRRGTQVDEPVSICALKRFVADFEVAHPPPDNDKPAPVAKGTKETGSRVAVIGAGPSGLTVAYFLARAGVHCDIFETLPIAGGMLSVGIPDYRLPPEVLRREIAAIEDLGVTIHLNHPVDDAEWSRLQADYDAVFVGVGAHRARALDVPGEGLDGVRSGVDFLREVNLANARGRTLPTVGRNVVVIGGGNTAIDSAMVAQRLGAERVTILYRRSRSEMLANPWEIAEAEDEGIQFHFLASPVRALGTDNRIVALQCVLNELGEPDQSGRRRPVPIPDSAFAIPCDTLLSAIGQTVSCSFDGLEVSRGGSILVDPVTLQTNLAAVYAGGDAVIGPASVIESIGDGRRAVESILRYLNGQDLVTGRTAARVDTTHIDYYTPAPPITRARAQMPHISREKRRSFAEVALGLNAEQAVQEAERCLSCGVCSECLACVAVCQPGAIDLNQQGEHLILEAGAIIWSDSAGAPPPLTRGNIYEIYGGDLLAASAVAARAMGDLAGYRQKRPVPQWAACDSQSRIGVFVCRCGDRIGGVLDVEGLVAGACRQPGVVCAEPLDFACQPDGTAQIRETMVQRSLNRVVLAACSCCSLDQVCDSCTYQRVRCKSNLQSIPMDLLNLPAEFVNIREQCAWVHRDDPVGGTAKANRMIAAAVAKAATPNLALREPPAVAYLDGRVVVAGPGLAADYCADALHAQNLAVFRSTGMPQAFAGTLGQFRITLDGSGVDCSAVVLAPNHMAEVDGLTMQAGLFVCPPTVDPEMVGAATAARVGASLGASRVVAAPIAAWVDPARCRACGTCESLCEHLAIRVLEINGRRCARVDAVLCPGCGACVARCPSSAIAGGYSTDEQIGAMLEALLG